MWKSACKKRWCWYWQPEPDVLLWAEQSASREHWLHSDSFNKSGLNVYFHSFNNYNLVSPNNFKQKHWHKQLYHIYLKSSFRSVERHPARPAPVHLQLNQFRKPIFFQTFQYWEGQGCYSHLIKTECSIISKSIAVSIRIGEGLDRE